MELKIIDAYRLYNNIHAMKKLKGSKFEFNFLLIEIKKKLKPKLDETDELKKALLEERGELIVKHCTKKEDGSADVIYTEKGNTIHKGLALGECPEYDERMKEIDKNVDEIDNELFDFAIDDIKKIKKSQCPEKELTGEYWEVLEYWIEDFS